MKEYLPYLDHGFVCLIDTMGSDEDIVRAAKTSYAGNNEELLVLKEIKRLIRYLMRKRHTSPFEMGEVKFHLKLPIFVMRQHVRHRTASLNEYSGRYSVMSDEFYLPDLDRMRGQDEHNRQGSAEEPLTLEIASEIRNGMEEVYVAAYAKYQDSIGKGLAKEVARIQLPLANYTELYWKIDLHNFFHFVKLRMDPGHAQDEIVLFATLMYDEVKKEFPLSCEAFEDYVLFAQTFSRLELKVLKQLLYDDTVNVDDCDTEGMSKREVKDLKDKLLAICKMT